MKLLLRLCVNKKEDDRLKCFTQTEAHNIGKHKHCSTLGPWGPMGPSQIYMK